MSLSAHSRHCHRDRQPFVRQQDVVDAHADHEYGEAAIEFGCETFVADHGAPVRFGPGRALRIPSQWALISASNGV